MHINLTDNNYQGANLLQSLVPLENQIFSLEQVESVIESLKEISGKKISELTKDNSSILVYPENFETYKDDVGSLSILDLICADDKSYYVKTGNLMGFIGVGDTTIHIKSRFDSSENDNFLHYMLSKVFKINLVKYKTSSMHNDDALNLLYFLFPRLLQKALSKGVFRKYQTFARNDSSVKGPIDIARHIKKNIPFNGRIAYNSREFSYDNEVTQLIRHTIEVINHSDFGKAILTNDDEMRLCVNQILQATPSYSKRERLIIIQKNAKPLKHSFYAEYSDLQKLCLAILRRKTLAFHKTNKNEICGIIFDGAWLWEEYLWTVLKDCGFLHPENKTGKGGIYLFEKWNEAENQIDDKTYHSRYRRYPDFFKKGDFILDAKYKRLENASIARDDMHQIISYMYAEKAQKGGVIFPRKLVLIENEINESEIKIKNPVGTLRGYGGEIFSYAVPIPQNSSSLSEFSNNMLQIEKSLITSLLP